MTLRRQKYLAAFGALVAVGIVLAANAHLVVVAFESQPACVAVADAAQPAKRAC